MKEAKIAICVFAYNRPNHLSSTLTALSLNDEARHLDLRIYVDGPRSHADAAACSDTLHVCHRKWDFKSVTIIKREKNLGLYLSLTGGIAETFDHYDTAIILEDDIFASPHLLRYFLDALDVYRDAKKVASIHGYNPPIRQNLPETFFLRGADCWGWATWRDRWKLFRHDAAAMAQEIRQRGLVREFNLNGHYDFLGMLDARAAGSNNSWAICWHASCFLANKLTLYPGKSLVKNIGLDGSGEHCGPSKVMESHASLTSVRVEKIPIEVNSSVYSKYCNHFSGDRPSIPMLKTIKTRFVNRLLQVFKQDDHSELALIGPYDSYEEAAERSSGYESNVILDKVYKAVVDVLEGHSAYERDGTAFAKRPPTDHLRRLLSTHLKKNDVVVDFGGGLGGAFINNRDLFGHSNRCYVVEQSIFSEAGYELSHKNELGIHFVDNILYLNVKPDIIILSSVLQYLRDPKRVLHEIGLLQPRCVIIDRTAIRYDNSLRWYGQDCTDYYGSPVILTFCALPKKMLMSALPGYELQETWVNDFDPPMHFGFLFVSTSTA